jgi:hypothetical protein
MALANWTVLGEKFSTNVVLIPGEESRAKSPPEWVAKLWTPLRDGHLKLTRQRFVNYAKLLKASRFGLIGCGDTSTNRRLSDAIMAGAIPIFGDMRWFHRESGVDFGEHWGWEDASWADELVHVPFPWRVDYGKLALVVAEVEANKTAMGAVQYAMERLLHDTPSLEAKLRYVFESREELIYGYGSPTLAAEHTNKTDHQGAKSRFGKVADNVRVKSEMIVFVECCLPTPPLFSGRPCVQTCTTSC